MAERQGGDVPLRVALYALNRAEEGASAEALKKTVEEVLKEKG